MYNYTTHNALQNIDTPMTLTSLNDLTQSSIQKGTNNFWVIILGISKCKKQEIYDPMV